MTPQICRISAASEPSRSRRLGAKSFVVNEVNGEPGGNRTPNPQIKSLLLCQLSYRPYELLSCQDFSGRHFREGQNVSSKPCPDQPPVRQTKTLPHQRSLRRLARSEPAAESS